MDQPRLKFYKNYVNNSKKKKIPVFFYYFHYLNIEWDFLIEDSFTEEEFIPLEKMLIQENNTVGVLIDNKNFFWLNNSTTAINFNFKINQKKINCKKIYFNNNKETVNLIKF